jgi:hypothetical protein
MTEAATDSATQPTPVDPVARTDWFLQYFVNNANNLGVEIDVALHVAGLVVTGTLTSGQRYFELMGDALSKATTNMPEVTEALKAVAKFGDFYAPRDEEEKSDRPDTPQYIHLRNARYFSPAGGPIPASGGLLWRGRVTEVSGFSIGSWTAA